MRTCPTCQTQIDAERALCPRCGASLSSNGNSASLNEPSTMEGGESLLVDETVAVGEASGQGQVRHGRFLPGDIIQERYRIVGLLGTGGMGEVYRADDLTLEQTVALKFLPDELSQDAGRLQRILNEVRIARQVSHGNVCRVYDIGEVDKSVFISMEYVDGEDLASLLRRIGRLPRDKAIELSNQLCTGLAAAHERGILHRDLKPMNIMIDGRGTVRITDFGLATLDGDEDRSDPRAGTPAYMSPEQLAGETISIQSDIYALGLVLYELFTGQRAFKARTLPELHKLHSRRSVTMPSSILDDLDPAVERVILHCLEPDPRDRPKTALAVAAALPGGDPLAAALAAGETPSPELVAASLRAEGVPPLVAAACLAVILIGLFAMPAFNSQIQLHGFVPMENSPEVLAFRAREILLSTGHAYAPPDRAYGFEVAAEYLDWIEASNPDQNRWNELVTNTPPAMWFWYRESPEFMVPNDPSGRVTFDEPALTRPGMARVRLSPQGHLLSLLVVPPEEDLTYENAEPIGFERLLEASNVLPARCQPVTPGRVPPVFCDERVAWEGELAHAPDQLVHIEAGAYRGRPIWFQCTYKGRSALWKADPSRSLARETTEFLQGLVFIVALLGATILARRNLDLRRGDRRGASRIALFVAIAFLSAWVLRADHVPHFGQQLQLASAAVGRGLFIAAASWVFYIALEPHLRRRWPDMLISWSRLLVGKVRDPLVGRDIIIGGLFGMFAMVLTGARHFGPGWFGAPPPQPAAVDTSTFLGLRYELTLLIEILTTAFFQPMALLVLLLGLLVVLRTRVAAVLAFYVVIVTAAVFTSADTGLSLWVSGVYFAALLGALLMVLMRFGMLAMMVGLFYMLLLTHYPITDDGASWYISTTFFALGIAGALAIYGYSISLGGRSFLQGDLLRD